MPKSISQASQDEACSAVLRRPYQLSLVLILQRLEAHLNHSYKSLPEREITLKSSAMDHQVNSMYLE